MTLPVPRRTHPNRTASVYSDGYAAVKFLPRQTGRVAQEKRARAEPAARDGVKLPSHRRPRPSRSRNRRTMMLTRSAALALAAGLLAVSPAVAAPKPKSVGSI